MKRFVALVLAAMFCLAAFPVTALAVDPTITVDIDPGEVYQAGVTYEIDILDYNGSRIDRDYRKKFDIDIWVSDNFKGTFKLDRQDDDYVLLLRPRGGSGDDGQREISYTITSTQKNDETNRCVVTGTFDVDYSWHETGSDQLYFGENEGKVSIPEDTGKVTIEFDRMAKLVTYVDKKVKTNVVFNYDTTDAINEAWVANPGVDFQVLNFTSRPTFPTGTFYVYHPTGYDYLYKFTGDGYQRVNAELEDNWFKFTETTLGCYVMATGPLSGAISGTTGGAQQVTQQPQQGAQQPVNGQVMNPSTGAPTLWDWILSLFSLL